MSDTLKALNEAFNSTTALEAVEDARDTRRALTPPRSLTILAPTFLPEAAVCRRYGVSRHDDHPVGARRAPRLSPSPLIRGRKYRRLSELLEFEERQAKDPQVTRMEAARLRRGQRRGRLGDYGRLERERVRTLFWSKLRPRPFRPARRSRLRALSDRRPARG